jgi:hypothetical protein
MPVRSVPARPLPCTLTLAAWVRIGIATLAGAVLLVAMSFPPAGPETHPVRGRILLDGQPLPQASVVFHPLSEELSAVVRPSGQAGGDGFYTLSTYRSGDGAPAGEYAVTIEWRPLIDTCDLPGSVPGPNRLPRRYSRPETSPLRVRVVPGNNELPPLELTRQPIASPISQTLWSPDQHIRRNDP